MSTDPSTPTRWRRILAGSYESRVLPFLWLRGEPTEQLTEYLEAIAASDIREVCLESRPHPDFCGAQWWDDLNHIIDVCKRLGLKIWILDDAHFPTGFANGALKDADPTLRKTVLTHRTIDLVGPTPSASISLAEFIDQTARFHSVAFLRDGKPVDLPYRIEADAAGTPVRIRLDAPTGLTQAHLLFTSHATSYNEDYINMVDKTSCDQLIKAVYEPHFEHVGAEFGSTILGFFSDEPGFANEKGGLCEDGTTSDALIGKAAMPLPWSDELERRLHDALGVEGMRALPLLWNRSERGAWVRHRYMDIATQLYRSCFTENLGTWCRAHGVSYIGHVIEDKGSHARLGAGAGHYFRAVAGQDMAGVDVVINQLVPGIDRGTHSYGRGMWNMEFFTYALAKLGSSAAHLDPLKQGRCVAEVFGAFGWHEGLREMKWIADHFLVRGVNRFVPHAFSLAPFPDFDCPPHLYAHGQNPQYRHLGTLMSYMNRMGTLLSDGHASTPVAVLYEAEALWAGAAEPMERICAELTRAQIDFDIVPCELLAQACFGTDAVDDSTFTIEGQAFRCLVLPGSRFTGRTVCDFLANAQAHNVPTFVAGAVPELLYDVIDETGKAASAPCDRTGIVHTNPRACAELLAGHGMATVRTSSPEPWLRALRYTAADETYLMLFNEHPKKAISTQVTLGDGSALMGTRLDMLTGNSVAFTGTLELAPYESCVIVLSSPDAHTEAPIQAHVDTHESTLNGPWQLSFASAAAYPVFDDERQIETLVDLTDEVLPNTAGTYAYRIDITCPDAATVSIDLGEVYETAEVFLDGVSCGVRIAPPYRFELGACSAGVHELRIEVVNTLDHAVPDFCSLTEPTEPTGVLGPVRLLFS